MAITPQAKDRLIVFNDFLDKRKNQIEGALPKFLTLERFLRGVLTQIRLVPKILDCDPGSIWIAMMQAAQLGLEFGPLQHCFLIPYGKECQFQLGYRGMIDLARRSGEVPSLYAHAVYKNDHFEYELGLNPKCEHKPVLENRGDLIAVYGIAKIKGSDPMIDVMSKGDIDKIRARSKTANSSTSPWKTDYDEMGKKTVIRRMFKTLPTSIEKLSLSDVAKMDEAYEIGETPSLLLTEGDLNFPLLDGSAADPIDNMMATLQDVNLATGEIKAK